MQYESKQTNTYVSEGWSNWTKYTEPMFTGQNSIAADPCVFIDGPLYRMFYSGFDYEKNGSVICQAISKDGYVWDYVENDQPIKGKMLDYRQGKWDDSHETPFAIKVASEYLLFFSGYVNRGSVFNSFPAHLGLAYSNNPLNFSSRIDDPVMYTTSGGYDKNAIFSPSIVYHENKFHMIYTGWTTTKSGTPQINICGATSYNGRDWVKLEKPVLTQSDLHWLKNGAGEPDLIYAPDGHWYLFFTILNGDDPHDLSIARSKNPFGPWEINPNPILRPTPGTFDEGAIVAPSVIVDGNKVRMWYSGVNREHAQIKIGYAECSWPLKI